MKDKIENNNKLNKKNQKHDLDKCVTTAHPEMARNYEDDEPCDDGR